MRKIGCLLVSGRCWIFISLKLPVEFVCFLKFGASCIELSVCVCFLGSLKNRLTFFGMRQNCGQVSPSPVAGLSDN